MDYRKHYDKLINRAKTREKPNCYTEDHHIIPRCMGGGDDPDNIATLTPEEHFTAHLLLGKMYPKHGGIWMAVRMMCRNLHGRRQTNKEYAWIRRRISETMSDTIREAWARKYGFPDYITQCEAVFSEFLKCGVKSLAGQKFGLSKPNSSQSVDFWADLTDRQI